MHLHKIVICSSQCGDWHGMYVDGQLFCEGHTLHEYEWMMVIQRYRFFDSEIKHFEVLDEYMEHKGNFPYKFEDLPKDLLFSDKKA